MSAGATSCLGRWPSWFGPASIGTTLSSTAIKSRRWRPATSAGWNCYPMARAVTVVSENRGVYRQRDTSQPGYGMVHGALRLIYGPAREYPCRSCGKQATDWAYQYTGDPEYINRDGMRYSTHPDDYAPLCRSCHILFDLEKDPTLKDRRNSGSKPGRPGGTHGAEALHARRGVDPEFDEYFRSVTKRAGAVGGRINSARKRVCDKCGLSANPGNMANHQNAKGHSGWTE